MRLILPGARPLMLLVAPILFSALMAAFVRPMLGEKLGQELTPPRPEKAVGDARAIAGLYKNLLAEMQNNQALEQQATHRDQASEYLLAQLQREPLPEPAVQVATEQPGGTRRVVPPQERFAVDFTMIGQSARASVNGVVYREGDSIDDAVLEQVEHNRVGLRVGERLHWLPLVRFGSDTTEHSGEDS